MELLRDVVVLSDPPLAEEEPADPPPTSFLPLSFKRTQEMMITSHSEPWKIYKNIMKYCLFQIVTSKFWAKFFCQSGGKSKYFK